MDVQITKPTVAIPGTKRTRTVAETNASINRLKTRLIIMRRPQFERHGQALLPEPKQWGGEALFLEVETDTPRAGRTRFVPVEIRWPHVSGRSRPSPWPRLDSRAILRAHQRVPWRRQLAQYIRLRR